MIKLGVAGHNALPTMQYLLLVMPSYILIIMILTELVQTCISEWDYQWKIFMNEHWLQLSFIPEIYRQIQLWYTINTIFARFIKGIPFFQVHGTFLNYLLNMFIYADTSWHRVEFVRSMWLDLMIKHNIFTRKRLHVLQYPWQVSWCFLTSNWASLVLQTCFCIIIIISSGLLHRLLKLVCINTWRTII